MKRVNFMLLTTAFALGYAAPVFSQQTLPEVTVVPANYKYLKTVGGKEVAIPVERLQRAAATYDITKSEYYEEDYDTYFISFKLPDGELLAAYDQKGKLMHTAERYKNIQLPSAVTRAVVEKYPKWAISKDVYLVKYFDDKGGSAVTKYKLILLNGTKRIRVQVNENGEVS